jgi:recombination protein RecT
MPTADEVKRDLVQRGESRDFPTMLKLYEDQVARALPEHLKNNVARYTRLALTQFRQNSTLAKCEPKSIFAGVILASQLGLELGALGHGYLVPYKNRKTGEYEAQFVPGWKGYVDLVHRSGRSIVWTGCVYEGDDFSFRLGDNPFVHHVPRGKDDESLITHCYAVGRIKGMDWPIVECWPIDRVKRHLERYNKVGDSHYAYENKEMYGRKVVLLQVVKYLPTSVELSAMVSLDASVERGHSQELTIDTAAAGMFFSDDRGEEPAANGNGFERVAEPERPAPVEVKEVKPVVAKPVPEPPKKAEPVAAKPRPVPVAAPEPAPAPAVVAPPEPTVPIMAPEADDPDLAGLDEEIVGATHATAGDDEVINLLTRFREQATRLKWSPDEAAQALFGQEVVDLSVDQVASAVGTLTNTFKQIKGVLFPTARTAADSGGPPITKETLALIETEAKGLHVSGKKTSKLWLEAELEELSDATGLLLVEAMRKYPHK